MLYIRIKNNTRQAKQFVQYAETLPFVEIVKKETRKKKHTLQSKTVESPYDKDFVKEVQLSRKSKGTPILTEDLWK